MTIKFIHYKSRGEILSIDLPYVPQIGSMVNANLCFYEVVDVCTSIDTMMSSSPKLMSTTVVLKPCNP